MTKQFNLMATVAMFALGAAQSANAQTVEASEPEGNVDEIVVTATKRSGLYSVDVRLFIANAGV